MDNVEGMEEDKLISLSATPPYENTSPEELRWEEYQARKTAASPMTSKVATLGPFSVPNMVNVAGATLNSEVSTPNAVDNSGSAFKLFSNVGSLPMSSAMSSPGSGLMQRTPSPSAPILGLPFTSSSCLELKSNKPSCLEWPQHSLQMPLPSPITTITSSSSGTGEHHDISTQRPLASSTSAKIFAVPSRLSFMSSNVEGGSSAMQGISSLPDSGKSCQGRTISLLTSNQVFQKTVIRMQTWRHGSLKKDGPRISFLNDYDDTEDSRNLDTSFVARENPKAFLLRTPWLENGGTQNGTQKDHSIKAMLHGKHPSHSGSEVLMMNGT